MAEVLGFVARDVSGDQWASTLRVGVFEISKQSIRQRTRDPVLVGLGDEELAGAGIGQVADLYQRCRDVVVVQDLERPLMAPLGRFLEICGDGRE